MTKPHGQEKYRSRDNRSRVRTILREKWDPISLAGNSPDEYHAYADKAYVMMMYENATIDDVAGYLHWVASEHMMMSYWRDKYEECHAVARMIFALKADFQRSMQ